MADGNNALALIEPDQFFAPTPRDAMGGLLEQYDEMRARVENVAAIMTDARRIAVLPASARGKTLLDGYAHEWGAVYENEFAGTSISVTLLALERAE